MVTSPKDLGAMIYKKAFTGSTTSSEVAIAGCAEMVGQIGKYSFEPLDKISGWLGRLPGNIMMDENNIHSKHSLHAVFCTCYYLHEPSEMSKTCQDGLMFLAYLVAF